MNPLLKNLIKLAPVVMMCASTVFAYNTKYFEIQSGQIKVIDVANQKNDISLKWKLHSTDGFFTPKATVIKQLGDFECKIKNQILLTSDYNEETKIWTQAWEIKVQWQPGTDYSGCLIQITHPNETSSFAELVMNYNFNFRAQSKKTPTEPNNPQCESYECNGGGGNSPGNGGPDDTSDGPSRDDGNGGGFDGGGYSGDDYNT
jgi:hypothetical protein